ncbi:MAG: DoxX family protein [Novosphingobium sp.]
MTRNVLRWILALFYFAAGVIHIAAPAPFLTIMPGWVPMPETVVLWTGIAELLGALGLAQGLSPSLRKAAAIGLALYAVCVFPANINHFALDMAKPGHGAGLAYHVPRMFAQPLLVWLALWTGDVINWPLKARGR